MVAGRVLDRLCAEGEIGAHVGRRLEMELSVKVAVIADRVSLVSDALYEIRPLLGVSPEDEERRANSPRFERVENERSRVGIRAVVKGQRD